MNQFSVSTQFSVGDARTWMNQICGQHDLIVKKKSQLSFQHEYIRLSDQAMALGYVQYGTDATILNEKKLHCYSLSLPLSGEQELTFNACHILSNREVGLILNPQEEQTLSISGNCKKLHLAIPKAKMEQVLSELLHQPLQQDLIFLPEMQMQSLYISHWWRQIQSYVEDLQILGVHQMQYLHQDMEKVLIKKLLMLQPHNYSDVLSRQLHQHQPKELVWAEQFIQQHLQVQLTLPMLCEVAHVSASKLNQLFKDAHAMSPMQYVKQCRLKQVHEMILQKPHVNISDIAMSYGFNHMGHFTQDYKLLFNQTPKQTAKAQC